MTITKQQLADLINGLGSTYLSSGAYEGNDALVTLGTIVQVIARDVASSPTETYEVPPVRA